MEMKLYFQFHVQVFEEISIHFWCNFIVGFKMPWGMIGAKVYECNYTLFLLLPNKIYRRYNQPFRLNDAFNFIMEVFKTSIIGTCSIWTLKKETIIDFCVRGIDRIKIKLELQFIKKIYLKYFSDINKIKIFHKLFFGLTIQSFMII